MQIFLFARVQLCKTHSFDSLLFLYAYSFYVHTTYNGQCADVLTVQIDSQNIHLTLINFRFVTLHHYSLSTIYFKACFEETRTTIERNNLFFYIQSIQYLRQCMASVYCLLIYISTNFYIQPNMFETKHLYI